MYIPEYSCLLREVVSVGEYLHRVHTEGGMPKALPFISLSSSLLYSLSPSSRRKYYGAPLSFIRSPSFHRRTVGWKKRARKCERDGATEKGDAVWNNPAAAVAAIAVVSNPRCSLRSSGREFAVPAAPWMLLLSVSSVTGTEPSVARRGAHGGRHRGWIELTGFSLSLAFLCACS